MGAEERVTLRESAVEEYFSQKSGYWDSLYTEEGGLDAFTKYELRARKELVFDLIDKISPDRSGRVLDLGCGSGQYLARLFAMGFDCCGADLSEEMLRRAREKLPRNAAVQWIHSDCRSVPVENAGFNLILCVGVLEYLADDSSALREMRRLIKPDGLVILTLPNLYKLRNILNPYYCMVRIWTYSFGGKSLRRTSAAGQDGTVQLDYNKAFTNRYSLFHIAKMASRSGFRVVEVRSACFGPFSLWKNEMLPLRVSEKISEWLAGLAGSRMFGFLKFFANRWVVLLQPRPQLSDSANREGRFETDE